MAVTLRHLGPVLGTAFQARGNDRYGDPRVEINCIIPQWSMGTKGGDSKAPCISLCLVCNGSNRRQRLQAQRPSYHSVKRLPLFAVEKRSDVARGGFNLCRQGCSKT